MIINKILIQTIPTHLGRIRNTLLSSRQETNIFSTGGFLLISNNVNLKLYFTGSTEASSAFRKDSQLP